MLSLNQKKVKNGRRKSLGSLKVPPAQQLVVTFDEHQKGSHSLVSIFFCRFTPSQPEFTSTLFFILFYFQTFRPSEVKQALWLLYTLLVSPYLRFLRLYNTIQYQPSSAQASELPCSVS